MKDTVDVFPDTNVFLHYPPLAEIDWRKLCDADNVNLVICLPVVHELDDKKSHPQLSSRAQHAIKAIHEAHREGVAIREKVTLSIFNHELRQSDFPTTLSPDSSDDRIVHLARVYREQHPERSIAIATEDMGMELRCAAGGVAVVQMDSAVRLENPQDEISKKHKQTVEELARLKNRLPKLGLEIGSPGFDNPPGRPPSFEVNDLWKPLDIEAALVDIRRKNPKQAPLHAQPKEVEPPSDFPSIARTVSKIHLAEMKRLLSDQSEEVTEGEWKAYDAKLDVYFDLCRKCLEQQNDLESEKARAITFELVIGNDGTLPATDIDATISWPPAFGWMGECSTKDAERFEQPMGLPAPPEIPKPRSLGKLASALMSHEYLRHIPVMPKFDFSRLVSPKPTVTLIRTVEGSWQFDIRLARLKHGHSVGLGRFLAVFRSFDDATSFSASFTISSAERAEKTEANLHIIVRRATQKAGPQGEDVQEVTS